MNNRYVIRFAGSGGQGVVLASVFLAQAAVLNGSKVVQSQTYGPETRGGMCQAYTIISNEDIWFTKPEKSDVLIALTQADTPHLCFYTDAESAAESASKVSLAVLAQIFSAANDAIDALSKNASIPLTLVNFAVSATA